MKLSILQMGVHALSVLQASGAPMAGISFPVRGVSTLQEVKLGAFIQPCVCAGWVLWDLNVTSVLVPSTVLLEARLSTQ